MLRLPINKITIETTAAPAIAPAIGWVDGVSNKLMTAEINAPIPICKAPIKDAAVPAFLVNGANDSEAALGLVIPIQVSAKNKKVMVKGSVNQPMMEVMKKSEPTTA